MSAVNMAEQGGFDLSKAEMRVKITFTEEGWNPNEILHSDGLNGQIDESTKEFKGARFVYAMGPGTLLYPELEVDKHDAPMVRAVEGGAQFIPRTGEKPLKELEAPSGYEATEEELANTGAQQVMPGKMLAFDPTRTFWHQAPQTNRPILVIDVAEEELHT